LNCLIAMIMLPAGFVVFTSAGIHLSLALLTADLCYDMDLHLKYYSYDNATKHLPENLVWVPPDTLPCSTSGASTQFDFLQQELASGMDKAVQGVCSELETKCESTDPSRFFMDCSGLSTGPFGTTSRWAGSYPTFTHSCDRLTNTGAVKTSLMVRDIQSDPRSVTYTSLSNSVKTCLAQARSNSIAYYKNNFAGAIPLVGAQPDWTWTVGSPTPAETAATLTWSSTPPSTDEVLECYAVTSPLKTLASCATTCATGLPSDLSMRTQSAEIVTKLDQGSTTLTRLNTLLDEKVKPLSSCKWISDIFSGLYYPMCVEANAGFINITISNLLSGIALCFALPLAVMSTKRIRVYDVDTIWKEASI
jgi:hypothetical protein